MYALPQYAVWTSTLSGEAELKHAEWNRQIAVREAEAKKDAASLLAQAEIERAKGVAQANQIIGDSLKNNEQYLRYLWVDSLSHTNNQIVYIPTEAGMPILEAGRSTTGSKIVNIAKEILR
jgi:regulator of protease activity HflC (stomatin/prohibitin superfamily)